MGDKFAYHVTDIEVIDPNSKMPVTVSLFKLESGGIFGVDGSYLEQVATEDYDPVFEPFDGTKVLLIGA